VTAPLARERLVARTRRLELPEPPDLVALAGDSGLLFTRDGSGFAARGEALRIDLSGGLAHSADAVAEALAAIAVDDEVDGPGTGPVALGALPFDRERRAWLTVPECLVGIGPDGFAWLTTIGPAGHERPGLDAFAPPAPAASPDGFTLAGSQSHDEWCAMVAQAVEVLRSGALAKVVLAREVHVQANRPIVVPAVLSRLRALYPSCTVFNMGGFLGASPELLVARRGDEVRTHPLAGTVAHSGDPEADARAAAGLLNSAKDRHEHRLMVEVVAGALADVCDSLHVPETPSIVPLRNVSHLGTLMSGTLRGPRPLDAVSLAARLHPTPAVAGVPAKEALAYIAEAEPFDRDLYAGPVGWMDANGDGEWVVGIRSATVRGSRARLVAGNGIVGDSSPEAELAETQLKLQALLAAVVRP
jgi:menaquinone-specific isochorismate synthase